VILGKLINDFFKVERRWSPSASLVAILLLSPIIPDFLKAEDPVDVACGGKHSVEKCSSSIPVCKEKEADLKQK